MGQGGEGVRRQSRGLAGVPDPIALNVLSAGAAKGLVGDLTGGFTAATGQPVAGIFSAVGAIRERFETGAPCDVLILTAEQLSELEAAGLVRPGSVSPIGTVRTAVAVLQGQPMPDISTCKTFAAAMREASAIFMPDPYRSTAGIHVRRVFEALGLIDALQSKLRTFPNGETAMRTFADAAPAGGIGLTQTTEILYTTGLSLVGPLPPEHDLATVYAAGVSATARDPVSAAVLVAELTGPGSAGLRRHSGFE